MADLRWGLLVFGIAVLAAVYLYSRFKSSIDKQIALISTRREPKISNIVAGHQSDGELTDEPSPEPAPLEMSDITTKKIIAMRLMAKNSGGFAADELILALRQHGLKHGQFGIFHRPDSDDEDQTNFSVASLVEPGSFDLSRLKKDYYPGVSIFLALPGPIDGVEAFDDMVNIARALAKQLGGELLDEQGSTLSLQRQRYLREEVVQFQHQSLSPFGDNSLLDDRRPVNLG